MAVVVNPGLDRSDGAPSSPVGRVITADQQTGGFQRKPIKEEEPEDDDEFLYCEDCRSYFINKCEVHGLALFISDTPVPLGIADRARQTLPLGLEVRKSNIPDAGLGVFNKGETIPLGAHFGPYEGDLVDREEAMNSDYSWVLCENLKTELCMTSDGGTSDFVEFVIPITVDQQKPIKKEELEDEDYLYGAPSSPVGRVITADQQTGGFQRKPIKEEEPEDDDEFLYCEDCRSYFINKCEVHGLALFISDTPVPLGIADRARQTLPLGLEVRKSSIPDAGLGVFNKGETIPLGAHFGPYEGDLVDREEAMNSGYSWVISRSRQCEKYIDGQREMHSNWMRYVNCARNEEEQNLVAFQYRGGILYRCCQPIKTGQELLMCTNFIPDRSRPGLTTTAIGAVDLQGAGGNWATVGRRSRGGRRVHRQREKRKGKSVGLRIGTLNVGTMTGKGRELADVMERRKVDILCVQETRWKGSKARSIGAGFKLFYYGVDSKRNGVGVVLKEELVRNVLEVKRVSDRVMSLKLEIEGVMLNVVSGYAPQVGCELEEKERFWSELDEVMESIPTGERVVIGADFNGHVGEGNTGDEEVMGKFGVKERNLEGQMVVDFAKRMDMAVVNTYFQKREEHRVTYKSGGRRTQVDYILCRRGNLKEISDCKVVVGESVARQHRMVVCRMTLMVCKKKRSKIEKKTKWWKLKKEECCEEFRQKLRQALGGQVVLPDDWETTAEVIRETGRKVLGVSSGRRKEDKETWWWNEEVQDSIQRKRLAKKKWDMDRTEENRQEYKELQRRVKREVSKAKQKAYDKLYTRLDTREGEKDLYRIARQRDRDGKDVQQVRVIKDRDGRVLTSEESVQRRWKEYFEELMNEENEREKRVEGVNSVEQKVDKIRKDEVRKALKRMKSGKAVGPDDIPVDVWKCLGEAAVEFLASLFNRVLESERMPEEWRRSVLVPIFKNKGDVQSCSNYRGIKLMSHTMKVWERVVEARLRKVVEICEQQYGFMPRKSTTDAIFALRILMEKYRDGQRELHCVFVDLEKAYDRVPREELWYCMRKSGVAEKYVRVVQDMYERSRTVVRCAVGQTEEFNVEVGLHQGSALSPFLFAIVMDQLSEEVRQESPWTMMFADDIVICSESREQVEENLERWRFALERRGMKVSRSKTEYMCVNEREGSGTVRLQGEEVKKVQEFKYLGSTVQSNGECRKEVKKRVQAGWNGWRKVSGVLCDQKISARIKGKVYRTVVRPAMLYGLETVSLRKRQESELELCGDVKTESCITSDDGTSSPVEFIILVDQQKLVKKEEPEDEVYPCGGTSSPVGCAMTIDQQTGGFQRESIKEEEPEDDEFLYCEECKSYFINKCEVHGPALFISDTSVPMGTADRAIQTLPPSLEVRKSEIPDAGLGVFNKGETIPLAAHFGPCEGDLVDREEAMNSAYSWVKPWMTREVKRLLRERNTAFRSGNQAHYSTARANLKRGIREAKLDYRRRIEDHLDSNNCRQVWQGVQHLIKFRTNPGAAEGDAMLAEKLNLFFARFEVEPAETATPHLMALRNLTLTVEESEFAYRGNRSTKDAVATALHAALSYLEKQGTYVRMLFVDYSSAFNTILPHMLVDKLEDLGLPHSTCMYVNCARNEEEQNLVAFQYRGGILYRCCQPIKPGQELLMWYKDDYGKDLGLAFDYLWKKKCSSNEMNDALLQVFSCSQCPISYTSQIYLDNHIRRNHHEKHMVMLLRESELDNVTHSTSTQQTSIGMFHTYTTRSRMQKEEFHCSDCGKVFAYQSHFHQHQCIHTGEKPFQCSKCEKRFNQKSTLQRHQDVHKGEKLYYCSQCGRSYTLFHTLSNHNHTSAFTQEKSHITAYSVRRVLLARVIFSNTSAFIQARSHITAHNVGKVSPARVIFNNTSGFTQARSHIIAHSEGRILPARVISEHTGVFIQERSRITVYSAVNVLLTRVVANNTSIFTHKRSPIIAYIVVNILHNSVI
ncbi:hypothetical protein QTP86_022960 [Hemibagrus guttatus]|nr:hypothetical protein QTP86_022960 [Hemibagrus guttatus]